MTGRTRWILRRALKIAKIACFIVLAIMVVVLLIGNSIKKNKIKEQRGIIKMYEDTYVNGNSSDNSSNIEAANQRIAELEIQLAEANRQNISLSQQLAAGTGDDASEVERQLAIANQRITELEQQLKEAGSESDQQVAQETDETYLNYKFPTDGNYYKDRENNQYYADVNCTVKLYNVRFMSNGIDDDIVAENGLYVYCLRMDDGRVCYMPQSKGWPDLITEEQYRTEKANQ